MLSPRIKCRRPALRPQRAMCLTAAAVPRASFTWMASASVYGAAKRTRHRFSSSRLCGTSGKQETSSHASGLGPGSQLSPMPAARRARRRCPPCCTLRKRQRSSSRPTSADCCDDQVDSHTPKPVSQASVQVTVSHHGALRSVLTIARRPQEIFSSLMAEGHSRPRRGPISSANRKSADRDERQQRRNKNAKQRCPSTIRTSWPVAFRRRANACKPR
jgi:hypothetical protein